MDRPDRVILMNFWHSKKSHDRIADKLLDKPLIFRHHLGNLAENPAHDLLHLFRVQAFRHGCIAREVGEYHSNMLTLTLSFLSFRLHPLFIAPLQQFLAALIAKLCPRR